MRLAAVFLVFGVVLAGCVGSEANPDSVQGQPDPSSLPPPSDTEGQIRGTVTDDSLAPVAGAQIGILSSDPQIVVTTNDAGQYAIVGLLPGAYTLQFQKLGFMAVTQQVDVKAGEVTEASVLLTPIAVNTDEARHFTIIGEGYFSCGAATDAIDWGNLHACVWDGHKPNVSFEAPKNLVGVMQEVVWTQSSGLTSQLLDISLIYGQACTPFCSVEHEFNDEEGRSPVRMYTDFTEGDIQDIIADIPEDPMPLKSVTFPADGEEHAVVVFQQRMTHYITLFWGEGETLETFTAIPDG